MPVLLLSLLSLLLLSSLFRLLYANNIFNGCGEMGRMKVSVNRWRNSMSKREGWTLSTYSYSPMRSANNNNERHSCRSNEQHELTTYVAPNALRSVVSRNVLYCIMVTLLVGILVAPNCGSLFEMKMPNKTHFLSYATTEATMASGGVEAPTSDGDNHVVVMRDGGDNVMRLADVGDNISSTADEQEPSYPPTKEITAADYYNPRNLTLDELEMVLYEWEEEATNIVKEYIDMRVIHSLRTGISIDDDWDDEEEEVQEQEVDKKNETITGSWMNRLQNLASSSNSDSAAAADTTKTTVEFHKHGPLKYLNLTSDTAHIVEFYAPWCPHCQNYKWRYMELAAEVLRRSITPGMFVCLFVFLTPFS